VRIAIVVLAHAASIVGIVGTIATPGFNSKETT